MPTRLERRAATTRDAARVAAVRRALATTRRNAPRQLDFSQPIARSSRPHFRPRRHLPCPARLRLETKLRGQGLAPPDQRAVAPAVHRARLGGGGHRRRRRDQPTGVVRHARLDQGPADRVLAQEQAEPRHRRVQCRMIVELPHERDGKSRLAIARAFCALLERRRAVACSAARPRGDRHDAGPRVGRAHGTRRGPRAGRGRDPTRPRAREPRARRRDDRDPARAARRDARSRGRPDAPRPARRRRAQRRPARRRGHRRSRRRAGADGPHPEQRRAALPRDRHPRRRRVQRGSAGGPGPWTGAGRARGHRRAARPGPRHRAARPRRRARDPVPAAEHVDATAGALVKSAGCLARIAAPVAPRVAMRGGSIESLSASIVATLDQIVDA